MCPRLQRPICKTISLISSYGVIQYNVNLNGLSRHISAVLYLRASFFFNYEWRDAVRVDAGPLVVNKFTIK
jgi:hypothetical protein